MAQYIDLAIDTISKLEKEVETCNHNASLSIFVATKFLEESISTGGEISYEAYSNHMKTVDVLATKFSQNCICINKQRIGTELRKVLTKYGHIK